MALQLSAADQAKMQMMQDLEIEMMSDLYNRMTQACHRKCIPPKYSEAELGMPEIQRMQGNQIFFFIFIVGKGESVCLDRCVAKYLDIHERIGKKLTAMSMQDESIMKNMGGDGK